MTFDSYFTRHVWPEKIIYYNGWRVSMWSNWSLELGVMNAQDIIVTGLCFFFFFFKVPIGWQRTESPWPNVLKILPKYKTFFLCLHSVTVKKGIWSQWFWVSTKLQPDWTCYHYHTCFICPTNPNIVPSKPAFPIGTSTGTTSITKCLDPW